ncbi:SpoIIE family protein phosphatase [Streptomyces sp. NPDC057445]|uniref:SpoIIE family protein phosphatase n=1 Tax=Streptomyces sp. NPDC057445 TaxID=3346136 RepID=UPI00367A01BF
MRHSPTSIALPPPVPGAACPCVFGITAYDVQTFAFEVGDLLLLYTDGAIEARNADGLFYPLTERAAPAWTMDDHPDELCCAIFRTICWPTSTDTSTTRPR